MSIILPQPVIPYNKSISLLPNMWRQTPPEGDLAVPIEIDWDGTNPSVDVNLTLSGVGQMSAIRSIYVNNESCGARIQIIFLDTQYVLTIPAYSTGLYPVMSNSKEFIVTCGVSDNSDGSNSPVAGSQDTTFLVVFNGLLPPVASVQPNIGTDQISGRIVLTSGAFSQTLLSGKTGRVTLINLAIDSFVGAAGGQAIWDQITVKDGHGNFLCLTGYGAPASFTDPARTLISLQNIFTSFFDGLVIASPFSGTNPTQGGLNYTIWYSPF